MSLLPSIKAPSDLRALSKKQLTALAAEIRQFLITNVSRTGGHLGPNLGVVELTMGIHLVFDSPRDPIIFDTGHQSYVHKILTGRADQFRTLRQRGGLSGYPSRAESEHDWVENSHASTSLSWAEGMAQAFRLQGEHDRHVVAVVGDGALTGGMTWEALNNIAVLDDLPLVIIVNDNGRSYAETVGGLANQFAGVRTDPRYEQTLDVVKRTVNRVPIVGRPAYDLLHGLKTALKDIFAPQSMFSDLGIKYLGPIDGHDLGEVVKTLQQAKGFGGPVIVHAMTRKGAGFKAAEDHEQDRFHAVGHINEFTGEPMSASLQATWTDAFAQEMVLIGDRHPNVVALTAAMLHPVGLGRFASGHPERVFDVGIAEQHAVTCAAGMAMAGLHPVFAVYSTFLNRAFDQVLLDVGMHRLGVTFVLDRAGVTGSDGASHNGMWDVSMLGLVPGLQLTSPRDRTRLNQALEHAIGVDDAPTVIRFSKDKLPDDIEAVQVKDGFELLTMGATEEVLIIATGQLVGTAMSVADRLGQQGIDVTVVDPLWVFPVNDALVEFAASFSLVVTIEDNLVVGGFGSHLELALDAAGHEVPMRQFGITHDYLETGSRTEVLEQVGLDARSIALSITETAIGLSDRPAHPIDVVSLTETEPTQAEQMQAQRPTKRDDQG